MLSAATIRGFTRTFGAVIENHRAKLDQLDAAAGDGDHGATIVMAVRAVQAKLDQLSDVPAPEALRVAALAVASVGGSTGPLWGTALLRAAQALEINGPTDLECYARAAVAAADGVRERGRCQEGDKTLLDALAPAARALRSAAREGANTDSAIHLAAEAARAGFEACISLTAVRGRARRSASGGRGHPDPGAATMLLFWNTLASEVGSIRALP